MNFIGLDIPRLQLTYFETGENLNSNICDGYRPRQKMDAWFCVPSQEPKKAL
jgi:hypothetical protein